jgi:DNA-directed RNA polymerase subunit alpha
VELKFKYVKSSVEESGHLVGHFIMTNLMAGQGLTIGNALRRVLLSNLEGTAITALRIPDASHEFSTLPYIREDVLEILLNLKQIILKTSEKKQISGKIRTKGPGIITANCIHFDSVVNIINPNQYIATICENKEIEFDVLAEYGVGYTFGEERKNIKSNFLQIDAIFMPVIKVNYKVNEVYLSYNETSESLILEITTNGSITPEKALSKASQKLMLWFRSLTSEEDLKPEKVEKQEQISKSEIILIEELQLPVRAYNCLKRSGINSVDELIKYSQEEIREIKNFGKKSADEVFHALQSKFDIILPSLKS